MTPIKRGPGRPPGLFEERTIAYRRIIREGVRRDETLEAIGAKIGVSRQRVSQIARAAGIAVHAPGGGSRVKVIAEIAGKVRRNGRRG